MIPYFTRLKLAFKTFFSILDHSRLPDETLSTFAPGQAAAATPRTSEPAPAPARLPTVPASPAVADDSPAAQVLALLQRDGRLIDFLMEDLSAYGDEQVGAAVRNVHASCRDVLRRYMTFEPVVVEQEGARVTVEPGTDPAMVKVVGNAAGRPPYEGIVRHRGWLVSRIDLPPAPAGARYVVAPAEVEVP
jgi:hypothetical protein